MAARAPRDRHRVERQPSAAQISASSSDDCDVYSDGIMTQRTFSGPIASAAMVATMALSIPPDKPQKHFLNPVLRM